MSTAIATFASSKSTTPKSDLKENLPAGVEQLRRSQEVYIIFVDDPSF